MPSIVASDSFRSEVGHKEPKQVYVSSIIIVQRFSNRDEDKPNLLFLQVCHTGSRQYCGWTWRQILSVLSWPEEGLEDNEKNEEQPERYVGIAL